MFFYIAKGLWFLLQPSTLIALLIGYGSILIWTGWARWGRRFVSIGAILLLFAGLSPLGNALILPLEDRFPGPASTIRRRRPALSFSAVPRIGWSAKRVACRR